MARTGHVRCQSTPNSQNASSGASHQNVGVHRQSDPIANIESSEEGVQPNPSPQSEHVAVEDSHVVPSVRRAPSYWTVDIINGEGHVTQTHLRVQDVFAFTESQIRIVSKWNRFRQPVGHFASLLAGYLGQLASNYGNFPILYETWIHVPAEYKNNVYVNTIQVNFVVNDTTHKKWILNSLGRKWKDSRCKLFDKYHSWELSLEENIQNHPPHINQDHWAIFVRYRRSPKAIAMAEQNAKNCEKLVNPHILGSKSLSRKRDEFETLHGRELTRAEMYLASHKRDNGTFVNETSRQIHENLVNEMENGCSESEAFVRVFGKEHPRYVRCMGFGVTPSQITESSFYSASSTTSLESDAKIEKMQGEIDTLKAQIAIILQGGMRGNQFQPPDLESSRDVRRSSGSSHVPEDHDH